MCNVVILIDGKAINATGRLGLLVRCLVDHAEQIAAIDTGDLSFNIGPFDVKVRLSQTLGKYKEAQD